MVCIFVRIFTDRICTETVKEYVQHVLGRLEFLSQTGLFGQILYVFLHVKKIPIEYVHCIWI